MTVNSSIKPSESYINKQITIGVIFTLIGGLALFVGVPHLFGLGILFLIIPVIQKNRDMIKICENNLELKFAPIGPTKFIRYADLVQVERISEKKIVLHYNQQDKPKKLRLPVHLFKAEDLTGFLAFLDTKTSTVA